MTQHEDYIDLDKLVVKTGLQRLACIISALVICTATILGGVYSIKADIKGMVTIRDFRDWRDDLSEGNPSIRVPRIRMTQREVEKHERDTATALKEKKHELNP